MDLRSVCLCLGISNRATADWRMAEEVTAGEGQEFDQEQVTVFDEQYQLFLGLALLLLIVEVLVPDRRRVSLGWSGRFK